MRKLFSSSAPICWTEASPKPASATLARSASACTAWANFTSISVPPAKSTPRLTRSGMSTRTRRIVAIETVTKVRRFARKSKFVPGLMISMRFSLCRSDGDRLLRSAREQELVDEPRHVDRREEGSDDPDAQRHREAADGAGAVLQEHEGRHERGHVRVEDGAEGLGVALADRRLRGAARPDLLADALADEHVGVHRHAEREHEA